MSEKFDYALEVGRPPTVCELFPDSKALLVSGEIIDLAMCGKGNAVAMAVNGRNELVIRGALQAAQRQQKVQQRQRENEHEQEGTVHYV